MQMLKHIIEPKRLLVVWQTLQNQLGTGKRYIVGELSRVNDNIVLRYFPRDIDFEDALKNGFKGFAIFDINQEIHDKNVMNTLERRIPPHHRADFDDFLIYHRIDPSVGRTMSEFALLGYTGGKLPGDNFSFVHTFEEAPIPCELTIEAAGVRHSISSLPSLETLINHPIKFQAEPSNRNDPNAIEVILQEGKRLGYVNRAQTNIFHKWLSSNNTIEGYIERINGAPDRPNILLYVKVS